MWDIKLKLIVGIFKIKLLWKWDSNRIADKVKVEKGVRPEKNTHLFKSYNIRS